MEVDKPFFADEKVDSEAFDLLVDEDGLLFSLVSFIDGWVCCKRKRHEDISFPADRNNFFLLSL